jgi:hypothetical protein
MKVEIDAIELHRSFERHRAEPDVSPEDYVRRLRIGLGESLVGRHAVYLDSKYWIYLRDAHLDEPQHPTHPELLARLIELVTAGKVFCPLSATTFIELMKQSVPRSRATTAKLVDELSLGVSLCAEHERAATEVAYLFHENSGMLLSLHPRKNLMWVRLPFVFGGFHGETRSELFDDPWTVEKAFLDQLWTRNLVEMIEYLPVELPAIGLERTAGRLNELNDAHAPARRTFEELYVEEIAGGIDLVSDVGVEAMEKLFEATTSQPAGNTAESRAAHSASVHALLVGLARHGKAARYFPTLHVHARCHAANRWDTRRRLNENTIHDFHHAAAAIPYCDVFLTEHGLRSFLTAGHMGFGRDFACRIVSDSAEALMCIRSLSNIV